MKNLPSIIAGKRHAEPSVFQPENLLIIEAILH